MGVWHLCPECAEEIDDDCDILLCVHYERKTPAWGEIANQPKNMSPHQLDHSHEIGPEDDGAIQWSSRLTRPNSSNA